MALTGRRKTIKYPKIKSLSVTLTATGSASAADYGQSVDTALVQSAPLYKVLRFNRWRGGRHLLIGKPIIGPADLASVHIRMRSPTSVASC